MAYRPIQHISLTSSQSSIAFSAIPDLYTDLVLVSSLRSDFNGDEDTTNILINGVQSNQSNRIFYGDGTNDSGVEQAYIRAAEVVGNTATPDTFSTCRTYIPNYTSTTLEKIFSSEAVNHKYASDAYQFILSGTWASTAAITSLELIPLQGSNFLAKSFVTLYGVIADTDGTTTAS